MSIILVIAISITVKLLLFEIYAINSSSMEYTLLEGDKVFVNKIIYGPRIPSTVKEIPWLNLFWQKQTNDKHMPYKRLKVTSKVKNEDIIVFVHPYNNTKGFLIKRCIGLPGDTIEVRHGEIFLNNYLFKDSENIKILQPIDTNYFKNYLPDKCSYINEINGTWTKENFGPIVIPFKGMSVNLTLENFRVYQNAINFLENEKIIEINEKHFIEGEESTQYTFMKNYYFMIGDNRYLSNDSRDWGFVPEENIVGKAALILFSNSKDGIRWSRVFKSIN